MIGVVIGVVCSVIVFTIYSKDPQAVSEFKKKKKEQQEKKQKVEKEQKQALEKLKTDPNLLKKKEQSEKRIKQKLYEGLNEEDKRLLEEYMDEQKKKGKSEEQIIKQATSKAGIFMMLMMFIVVLLIFVVVVFATGTNLDDFDRMGKEFTKFLSGFYPKFKVNETVVATGVAGQPGFSQF